MNVIDDEPRVREIDKKGEKLNSEPLQSLFADLPAFSDAIKVLSVFKYSHVKVKLKGQLARLSSFLCVL